ncbi:MAG: HAD family hydrolase [Candidatus Micrarchaeota archaeon]
MKPRYICWDLDETLGYFRPGKKSEPLKGLKPLLERLQGEGMRHVVTTASPRIYAEAALRRTGLRGYIDAIFPDEVVVPKNVHKRYLPVAKSLGIDRYYAPDRMLVIGNDVMGGRDAPEDLPLVTILFPDAIKYHASVLGTLIVALSEHKSFWWSFETLLSKARDRRSNGIFQGGELEIDGVEFMIGHLAPNDLTFHAENLILVSGAGEERRATIATEDEPVEVRVREIEELQAAANF